MLKNKKIFYSFMLIVTILSVMLLSGCKQSEKTTVTLNYAGSYSNAMMLLIKELKLMEKYVPENVTIKWANLASSTEMRDALVTGGIDIVGLSIPSYMSAIESGLPLDMISFAGTTPIKLYTNNSNKKSISDLTGEDRIALVGLNTILHIAFLADAYKEFGNIDKFANSLVVMPHADGLAALSTGNQISAYITTFPTTIKADSTEGITMIHDFTDVVKEYGIGSVHVVTETFYNEHPDIVEAFLKAQKDAIDYVKTNLKDTLDIMSSDWDIDRKIIEDILEQMPLTNAIVGYDKLAALLYKIKFLEKEPTKFKNLKNYNELIKLNK